MLSKKSGKVPLLVVAVIFFVLSVGNILLRIDTCRQLHKPVSPPTEYSSEREQSDWIAYKKFCRNPAPYALLLLTGGYLASAIGKYREL